MSKTRTTVSVDEDLIDRAKEQELNISQVTERALREEIRRPQYYLFNTNKKNLPGIDGTKIYQLGVVATYGPIDTFGKLLENPSPGDYVFSYVNGVGIRALGKVTGEWDGRPVGENEPQVHEPSDEYHLPVRWMVVLDENKAITAEEFRKLAEFPVPTQTRQRINSSNHPELLAAVMKGRAY